MKKVIRKWLALCMLGVLLSTSVMETGVTSSLTAEAATVKRYYIYINDKQYELTSEQYSQVCALRNNDEELLNYLQRGLGIVLPEGTFTLHGSVVTSSDGTDISYADNYNTEDAMQQDGDFVVRNGVLYSYQGTATQVTIPNTVTSISSLAFYNNTTVKKIIVPSSVISISKYAFYNCSALKFIVFDKNNKTLTEPIITKCSKMTNIVAPKGSAAYLYAEKHDITVTTSTTPKFANKTRYLIVGDSEKNALLNNISGITWKSSKKSVVSVTSSGKIKAKKSGKATITATANSKKYTYKVVIYKKTITNRVKQVTKSCIKSGMSKYNKVKAVHNWLIRNVKYDYYRLQTQSIPQVSHTAKGALLKKIAVCDGYAHAYKMIMDKLKIPCKFVVGSSDGIGHAWNMVKLSGKWYHVDVTFDDPIINGSNTNTTTYYNYFLKCSSTMSKSHSWKKSKYPKCTSKKYE